jgi:hypothetical protein
MTIARERAVRPMPTWLVSARNGKRVATSAGLAEWRPFGIHHARQVGSLRTACGIAALDWELFWDMSFPSEPSVTCRHCLVTIASSEGTVAS